MIYDLSLLFDLIALELNYGGTLLCYLSFLYTNRQSMSLFSWIGPVLCHVMPGPRFCRWDK
jgi:hypothetical protein